MFVKKLAVQNVKSFSGEHSFTFRPGLNYLVGDNNCGKSSLFEAFVYLATGKSDDHFATMGDGLVTRVEILFSGAGLEDLLAEDKFAKYRDYLHTDQDGDSVLRIERSHEERTVVQSGKPVKLDGKKACFWHDGRQQFENPTGIDALFKALIEFEPVWADTDPTDLTDFGSTKTLGRLVDKAVEQFFGTDRWDEFTAAHDAAFGSDDDSIKQHTTALADEIGELVRQQYGHATVRFGFDLPVPSAFIKMGRLLVDDGAGETPIGGKGTGMKRAFALAIIQLYARSTAAASGSNRPLILLIDEPETWLHPSAQLRLAEALATIAQTQQLFLITHSPYLLRKFDATNHQLLVFKGMSDQRQVTYSQMMGVLGPGEPTWGEINFHAFGISSHEFHNELYGALERLVPPGKSGRVLEADVNTFLASKGIPQDRQWERPDRAPYAVTLPVYVRNTIHHPENTANAAFNDDELLTATRALLGVVGH